MKFFADICVFVQKHQNYTIIKYVMYQNKIATHSSYTYTLAWFYGNPRGFIINNSIKIYRLYFV